MLGGVPGRTPPPVVRRLLRVGDWVLGIAMIVAVAVVVVRVAFL
jgi:hypothetical protein